MLYGFSIAPSTSQGDISLEERAYSAQLLASTNQALEGPRTSFQEASLYCEYLDWVDSGTTCVNTSAYDQAELALLNYLQAHRGTPNACALAKRSPSAFALLNRPATANVA